jgi:hypothetical protein
MFCPKCGKEITDNSSFCNSCGQNLDGNSKVEVNYAVPLTDERKSRLAAGLLQIFLGSLGIGRFYLGYTTIGILQIVASIVTCGFAGGIWGLVDGILILTGSPATDANGMPLRD